MHRGLLVADEDVADGVLLEQRVVDRQDRAAGIAEDLFDPLADQAFDQDVCAAALGSHGRIPSQVSQRTDPAQQAAPGHFSVRFAPCQSRGGAATR